MLLWTRPKPPNGYYGRARQARQQIAKLLRSGSKLEFQDWWRSYKSNFSEAQNRKCAFCEVLETTFVGAIEHFRPKSALEELLDDPETWGREDPHTSNVQGRQPRRVSSVAYWWLAYSWHNWLFACERCNSAWKKALFPLSAGSRRWLTPWPRVREQALLLDPYGKEDPAGHLTFDSLGQVEAMPNSDQGFETIRTLGLDRESLRSKRAEKAKRVYALIERIHQSMIDEEIRASCADLVELGNDGYEHAGMVRILVRQKLDISWDFLEREFGR